MNEIQHETVIYGGAFNPPTRAHHAILQACVEYAEPRNADVWLLPSASRSDKAIETEYGRRLALCEALTRDVITRTVALSIETIELDRSRPTETYDTVQELQTLHPERSFTWVFGSDSVATMPEWGHGEWLCDNLRILAIGRAGVDLSGLRPLVTQLPVDAGTYSSTELRRRMENNEEYADMVTPHVYELLADKG